MFEYLCFIVSSYMFFFSVKMIIDFDGWEESAPLDWSASIIICVNNSYFWHDWDIYILSKHFIHFFPHNYILLPWKYGGFKCNSGYKLLLLNKFVLVSLLYSFLAWKFKAVVLPYNIDFHWNLQDLNWWQIIHEIFSCLAVLADQVWFAFFFD